MFYVFLYIFFSLSAQDFKVPKLASWVNDYANVLDAGFKNELDKALMGYEEKTGNQIFVLTVDSIKPYPSIEDYSMAVANEWKAGQKGVDNGIILVVSIKDRKVRIEVGYGLEAKLPDIIAGRIIREQIIPSFKTGNYQEGIKNGVYNIVKYIGTQKLSKSNIRKREKRSNFVFPLIFLLFFVGRIFIFPFFLPFGSSRGLGGFGGGSSFGGFGGGGGGSFGGGGASGSW